MGETPSPLPPGGGARQNWADAPERVRSAVEAWLGSPVLSAESQPAGFSPGVAARLRLADGRGVFVKAASSIPNPDTPAFHRREGRIMRALPGGIPAPRLLWTYDEGEPGWIVLVYEEVAGRHPRLPWQADELALILSAMADLASALTPSPLPPEITIKASQAFADKICGWRRLLEEKPDSLRAVDPWIRRRLKALVELEAGAPAAAAGDTLEHFDIRADNILLTDEQVWFLDWPSARVGAAWIDAVLMAPSVTMQGGIPPEAVIAQYPPCQTAAPSSITAVAAALAGYLVHNGLQPPPPGLPTLRAFQMAQGAVAIEWLKQRTGWM